MLEAEVRLARVAARQNGAFTRDQSIRAGFSASQVQRRLHAGAWIRVFPCVYRHAGSPPTRGLALTAAILWAAPDAVISHTTAAALWRVLRDAPRGIELLVPRTRSPRASGVVIHRVARLDPADVTTARGGLPVTTPVRTLIDVAAVVPEPELAAILDQAFTRGLVTRRVLQDRLATLGPRGRPGAARLRALLGAFGSASEHASARMAG